MSAPAFTPGPWICIAETDASNMLHSIYGADEDGDDGLLIARCDQNGEHSADAHLIAAAPELYEALAIARNILAANDLPTGPKIDAALSKARGESPSTHQDRDNVK